ncbi:MAG: hypothetical protein DSY80_01450 [Desulfocapsa sp.]|nr:MAG: hypothetical protein DSY80_01450 [Desulfocapsa sp.]
MKGIYVVCGKSEKQKDIMLYTAKLLRNRFLVVRIPIKLASAFAKLFGLSEHFKVLTSDRVFNFRKAVRDLNFKPRDIWSGIEEMVAIWRSRYEG